MRDQVKSDELLEWYDRHARILPWRVSPQCRAGGVNPDPYQVWLSEIMLQQTTVATVKSYFEKFTKKWPTVSDLASAQDDDVMGEWAGLGYYARARNLLKCARAVVKLGGTFPESRDALQKLPGIGPYTSSAIAAIAYDQPETVVDGNVERVISRVFAIEEPLPDTKPEITRLASTLTPLSRAGDYAQAIMDLGATICTPKSPACGICPWRSGCVACDLSIQHDLPKKKPKVPKPTRLGTAYVARTKSGHWLMERRPEKGLLGGMMGWPGGEWSEAPKSKPPLKANWQNSSVEVRHTFTHFHLKLSVETAEVELSDAPDSYMLIAGSDFSPASLPTVMRKVFDAALPNFSLD